MQCLEQPLKHQIQPSNMQRLQIERLPRLYDLPAYDYPRLLPHFSLILLLSGVSYSFGRMLNSSVDNAIVMQIVICNSHVARISLSRYELAQIKAHSAYYPLHGTRELTEILPPICNSAEQLGRSQPCRGEADRGATCGGSAWVVVEGA